MRHYPRSMSSKEVAKAMKADAKAAKESADRQKAHKARVVRDGDASGIPFPERDT